MFWASCNKSMWADIAQLAKCLQHKCGTWDQPQNSCAKARRGGVCFVTAAPGKQEWGPANLAKLASSRQVRDPVSKEGGWRSWGFHPRYTLACTHAHTNTKWADAPLCFMFLGWSVEENYCTFLLQTYLYFFTELMNQIILLEFKSNVSWERLCPPSS